MNRGFYLHKLSEGRGRGGGVDIAEKSRIYSKNLSTRNNNFSIHFRYCGFYLHELLERGMGAILPKIANLLSKNASTISIQFRIVNFVGTIFCAARGALETKSDGINSGGLQQESKDVRERNTASLPPAMSLRAHHPRKSFGTEGLFSKKRLR